MHKIYLEADLLEEVKEWCEMHSLSFSAFARKAIELLFRKVAKRNDSK